MFILGLLVGGLMLALLRPESFAETMPRGTVTLIIGGLCVGFGTRLGSGCTSGHGVCGIARFSPRSILATVTFMIAGALTVAIFKALVGSGS